ncbi:MAG: hypothetical protein ACK4M9_05645 [Anaerobacillus sp.]|uniref:hypothetical protein n=1 Tax=Anaerobacillus sp. TaxID=1872506 RepID=UPI00391C467B
MEDLFYISILVFAILIIIITFVTLPNVVGDERKRMIRTKAQAHAFSTMIFLLTYQAGRDFYSTFRGNDPYEAIPPFATLSGAAVIYIGSLLFFNRKYGK